MGLAAQRVKQERERAEDLLQQKLELEAEVVRLEGDQASSFAADASESAPTVGLTLGDAQEVIGAVINGS